MKLRKRTFKEIVGDINDLIDLGGTLVVLGIVAVIIGFIYFVKWRPPSDYEFETNGNVVSIVPKITMKQSKYKGNVSVLLGWQVSWKFQKREKLVLDSIFVSYLALSAKERNTMYKLVSGSEVKIKYNKEGKSFLVVED